MKPRIFKSDGFWFLNAELAGYLDSGPYLIPLSNWPKACELLGLLYRRKRIHRQLT